MSQDRSPVSKAKIVQALSQKSARKDPARAGARPQVTTLVLFGELRERELTKLGETLLHLARSGQLQVVLDLRNVSHVLYSAVKPLGLLARTFRLGGGDIKLAGPSRYLAEVLEAGGTHGVFEVYRSPEEATEAFTRDPLTPVAAAPVRAVETLAQVAATIIVIGK